MFQFIGRRDGGMLANKCTNILPTAVVFLMMLTGCAHQPVKPPHGFIPPGHSRLIQSVQFYPDDSKQCGPASLASVLNFHGGVYTVPEISAAVFRPDLGGTVTLEMVYFARKQGFKADWFSHGLPDLVDAIDHGHPLIVMVNYGFHRVSKYHFMVVVGYSPKGIVVFSGTEKNKLIPWAEFWETWSRADRWTMRVKGRK
jgi:ABC-type bacteriocin/lantibiotic exporter with double-glycine peptidase domain